MMRLAIVSGAILLFAFIAFLPACGGESQNGNGTREVILYTSLNEPTARAVLDAFEEKTGIRVRIQADTERDKTVGLVRTLIEERDNPRADVFWNSEVANSVRLREADVLEKLDPPPAGYDKIPAQYHDPEGYWFGFSARARILIVNTELVPEAERPGSMWDLLDPKWRGKAAIVRPVTGTTLTHLTTLYEVMEESEVERFIDGIHENECHLPPGNGRVAQLVGEGEIHFGFTDTSDYRLVKNQGKPVTAVYPDQDGDGLGTLVLPNTVSRIAGGPNPDEARALIEFLISPEAERILAFHERGHIPLNPEVEHPEEVLTPGMFRAMEVDFDRVGRRVAERMEQFDQRFR